VEVVVASVLNTRFRFDQVGERGVDHVGGWRVVVFVGEGTIDLPTGVTAVVTPGD
jgi:hypothetical protein